MTYRVGNHQPQNVYRGEQYIGVMFTAEDAALTVEALNGKAEGFGRWCENETNEKCSGLEALEARKAEPCIGICAGCTPECDLAGDSCTCSPLPGGLDPACPVHQGRRAESKAALHEGRRGAWLPVAGLRNDRTYDEPVADTEVGSHPDRPVLQGRRARGPKPPPHCPVVSASCPGDDRGTICSKPCRSDPAATATAPDAPARDTGR